MKRADLGAAGLLAAGVVAALAGAMHVVALIGGPRWIAALGAPEPILALARAGSWLVPAGGLAIAALMGSCAAWAFSGAARIRRLPLLRSGLAAIALVCIVRGLLVVPLAIARPEVMALVDGFEIGASVVWTLVGVAFAFGLAARWPELRRA